MEKRRNVAFAYASRTMTISVLTALRGSEIPTLEGHSGPFSLYTGLLKHSLNRKLLHTTTISKLFRCQLKTDEKKSKKKKSIQVIVLLHESCQIPRI